MENKLKQPFQNVDGKLTKTEPLQIKQVNNFTMSDLLNMRKF